MKSAWITDAHLKFLDKGVDLRRIGLVPWACDAILLGGDTAESDNLEFWLGKVVNTYKVPVYFVLGNHDYYGSTIGRVRKQARQVAKRNKLLQFLPDAGVVKLTENTSLVGHGGWGDARYGNFMESDVRLNDYVKIGDLVGFTKDHLRVKLGVCGDAAAESLRENLSLALDDRLVDRVLVLTHVPPFPEAAWHEGGPSDADWLPHFSCKATGDVLVEMADKHHKKTIQVLCGHTHSSGECWPRPNLRVTTGAAVYGDPRAQAPIMVP